MEEGRRKKEMFLSKDIQTRSIELGISEAGISKLTSSSKKFSSFIDSTERKIKREKRKLREAKEQEQELYDREI